MSWCQIKTAFLLTDAFPKLDEAVGDGTIWDKLDAKYLPTGWHLTETDCSGARCVLVFEVKDTIAQTDLDAVERLLEQLEREGARTAPKEISESVAIAFATDQCDTEDGMYFLRLLKENNWTHIRKEFPEFLELLEEADDER
jgi:hypothetical protein